MTTSLMNPYDLPLVPPMDLNSNLPDIDKISPFPMQLRTRRSVGLFLTRRQDSETIDGREALIRTHNGIDLLAPFGTKVFASASGIVANVTAGTVLLFHNNGFKFFTFYSHLQTINVTEKDPQGKPVLVSAGEQIGEIADYQSGPDHLHFEIRYPFNYAGLSRDETFPINPTFCMYNWEVKTYQNDEAARKVIDNVYIKSFEEIIRGRQLRFILCNVEGDNRNLFLPLQTGLQEDDSLATTLRHAFFANKKVRIVWRESLFFGKIQSGDDGCNKNEKVAIIAEIKVYK
jgi:hypothetical protein